MLMLIKLKAGYHQLDPLKVKVHIQDMAYLRLRLFLSWGCGN